MSGAAAAPAPPSTSPGDVALQKARELYDNVAPSLREFGLPMDELDNKLLSEVFQKAELPFQKLLGAFEDATRNGEGASRGLAKLTGALTGALEAFVTRELTPELAELLGRTLPRQLLALVQLLNTGLHNPSLLLPRLACSRLRGHTAPVPAPETAKHPQQQQHAGAAGDDGDEAYDEVTLGQMPEDVDISALGASCLGGSTRSRQWHSIVSTLKSIVDPLGNMLPELMSIGPLFGQAREQLAQTTRAADDMAAVVAACGEGKEAVVGFLQSLNFEFGADAASSSASADAGSGAGPAQQPPARARRSVMDQLGRAVELAKSMDQTRSTITGAVASFTQSIEAVYGLFRCLEDLAARLKSVNWKSMLDYIRKLHAAYPTLITSARQALLPHGLMSFLMSPSPYMQQVEEAITSLQSSMKLDMIANSLQAGLSRILVVLGLEREKRRVSRSMTASLNRVSIPVPRQAGALADPGGLGKRVLDPIKRQVDALVAVTRIQDIVLDNATRQWDLLLGNDVLAVVKKYIDTFSLEVVKQTTERLKHEALALKETALKEISKWKETALQEAENIKKLALDKAEELKQQAQQLAESLKATAMAQVGELQAKANALRSDAAEFMQDARAKILQEAEKRRQQILDMANLDASSIRSEAEGQANLLRSRAADEIRGLRERGMREINELRARAELEIQQLKEQVLSSLKQQGVQQASGMLTSFLGGGGGGGALFRESNTGVQPMARPEFRLPAQQARQAPTGYSRNLQHTGRELDFSLAPDDGLQSSDSEFEV